MPFDETSPGLDALLLAAVFEMELSERDLRVSARRYQMIPEHLQKPGGRLATLMENAELYAQGSRAIGATIISGDGDDRFDLDAVLEVATPIGWSSRRLLDELHEALKGFPDAKEIERCTRCIQIRFAFMHLDVTPLDPAGAPRTPKVGRIHHSPDDGGDETFPANPYGFAEWFRRQVKLPDAAFVRQAAALRARLDVKDRLDPQRVMADADIEALPDPVDPLRDAPQVIALKLMKRYLNLRYATRDEKRPISVYLSKIAAEVLPHPHGICAQLEAFAAVLERRMSEALETGLMPEERNPALLEENFNDRWPKDMRAVRLFRDDLRHLQRELRRARVSEVSEIVGIFGALFGEKVSGRAMKSYLDGMSAEAGREAYQPGKGYLAAPALSASSSVSAAPKSRAPEHRFHPGIRGR